MVWESINWDVIKHSTECRQCTTSFRARCTIKVGLKKKRNMGSASTVQIGNNSGKAKTTINPRIHWPLSLQRARFYGDMDSGSCEKMRSWNRFLNECSCFTIFYIKTKHLDHEQAYKWYSKNCTTSQAKWKWRESWCIGRSKNNERWKLGKTIWDMSSELKLYCQKA